MGCWSPPVQFVVLAAAALADAAPSTPNPTLQKWAGTITYPPYAATVPAAESKDSRTSAPNSHLFQCTSHKLANSLFSYPPCTVNRTGQGRVPVYHTVYRQKTIGIPTLPLQTTIRHYSNRLLVAVLQVPVLRYQLYYR